MPKFDIRITEEFEKIVTVEAEDLEDACELVEENWNNGEYILDAESFTGATFTLV